MGDIAELTESILKFRDEREWKQFHTPRNLATALSIEAAELQELFLWDGEGEESSRSGTRKESSEIADILIYALLFCHETGIDPREAVRRKLEKNRQRYPVEKARGRSTKYTEFDED